MRLEAVQATRGLPASTGLAAPSGADPFAAAIGQAGETAQTLVTTLQQRRTELQQATDLLHAQTALQDAAGALQRDLATDPDYRTMETRYPERFDAASARVVEGIEDRRVQLAAKQHAASLRAQLTGAVRTRAVTLQTEDFTGSLETRLDGLEREAADQEGDGLLATATRAFGMIDAGVAGGVYGRDDAVTRKLKFRDGVIQAKATRLITAVGQGVVPLDTALDRLASPDEVFVEADPVKREGWTASVLKAAEAYQGRLDRAQTALDRAAKTHSRQLRDFFTDKALRGELSAAEVQAVGPREAGGDGSLFGEDYEYVRVNLIQKQFEAGGVDDPRVVFAVTRDLVFGTIDAETIIAKAGRGLSNATAVKLAGEARTSVEANHPTKDPAWRFYRDQLFRDLTGVASPEQVGERIIGKQLAKLDLAMQAWWERTVDKREPPKQVYESIRDSLAGLAPLTIDPGDPPRFETKKDASAAYDRGLIDKEAVRRELLKHEAIEQAAPKPSPDGKSGGAKGGGVLDRFFGGR